MHFFPSSSQKARQQMTRNAVLHLKGMDPETTREEIKRFFSSHGDVGWVDFDKGVTEVRINHVTCILQ